MDITPSTKSGFFAGLGISALLWGIIVKLDALTKPLGLQRWINSEQTLDWITHNKSLFIVLLETVNVISHGVTNSAAIAVAIGIAVFNITVVTVFLPIRGLFRKDYSF